jgi:hypothetical protein
MDAQFRRRKARCERPTSPIETLSGSPEDPKFRAAFVYVVWLLVMSFVRILVEVDLDEDLRARTATIEMAGDFFQVHFRERWVFNV